MLLYYGCDGASFIAYTRYAPGTLPLDARFTACIGFLGGFKFLIKDFFIVAIGCGSGTLPLDARSTAYSDIFLYFIDCLFF